MNNSFRRLGTLLPQGNPDYHQSNLRERGALVTGLLLWTLTITLALGYLLGTNSHDWDLDSFLFLGDQLLRGNLLYVTEFETKLPFLQQLFSIPALLGGIGAWRLITFGVVAICHILSALFIVYLLRVESKVAWVTISGLGALLTYSLPEANSSHIGMVASSLQLLALVGGVFFARTKPALWQILVGATWAMASNIRPNLIIVYIFVIFTSFILDARNEPKECFKRALASAGGFGLFTLLTFAPYFQSASTFSLLFEGLYALAGFSSGSSATLLLLRFFINRYTIVFFASLVLVVVITVFYLSRPVGSPTEMGHTFQLAVPALAGLVGLFVSFMSSHYMAHHSVMFVPFSLILSVLLLLNMTTVAVRNSTLERFASLLMAVGLATSGPIAATLLVKSWDGVNWQINDRHIDPSLLAVLAQTKEDGYTFYVVDGSQYHFLLSEQRQGDGHPAMMAAFLSGDDVPILSENTDIESGSSNRCDALWARGPSLLVVTKPTSDLGSMAEECIRMRPDLYSQTSFPELHAHSKIFRLNNYPSGNR